MLNKIDQESYALINIKKILTLIKDILLISLI
jgi:hypothetical protein